jgi:signal transduction histidine kinase
MNNLDDNSLEIISHLQNSHFTGYWKKYDLLFTVCDSSRILDIKPENYLINCYDYFQAKVNDYGIGTYCKNLYYLRTESENEKYLGILDFSNSDFSLKIYIEVFSKFIPKGLGYPELLVDASSKKSNDWSKYSWAKYVNGKLIYRFGKYFYSFNLSNYRNEFDPSGFFNRNGYNHFYYPTNNSTVLILSKKNPGLLDIVAPFSYIFIFYGVLVFLIFLILRSPIEIKMFEFNFRKRLQLLITALILVSFFFTGIGSLFYIISLNDNKNNDILSEKTHSVLIELEHKLADMEGLSPEMEPYLSGLLHKFSLVFFSDINLYDLEGTLLATSRPEIFNKGLISNKMNSMAFNYMSNYRKTLFIHNESIGEYNYLSAYLPFRNEENNLIAYLNLPYFAKQDELTNEISTYLVAFINIYVILIAFAIFIALIISNYITKPLQLIKDKISRLKLGRTNEKIEWSKKDEIGSLVDEYNRMVDELANSAELLAKSERESAWREMAKQIAHEIKNPLTPMKLSVQYLQKAWDEKVPDWDKRLKRFTRTIVEQIESLSIIASEFSDFAKMPKSKFEKTEMIEVIKNSIGLFRNATQIKIELYYSDNHYVLADREQLLRVFNNLIKNALQAIIDPAKGLIEITVEQEMELVVITFKDNGKGIPKVQREKVFYPNFTTKSGGMGLGLAMVKNIIQNAGGEITFESEENVGTTFIVALPVYNPDTIQ